MGEPPLGKFEDHPEYNFLTRLPGGEVVWALSVSGVFRACYLPTGLLDWKPLDAHPAPPPPGRIRLYWLGSVLYFDNGTGPVVVGGGGGVSDFLALTDTPGTYVGQAGLVPIVNVGETALEFGSFPKDFLALLDTPGSYAGQGGLHVAVNVGETGLEFVPGGGGGGASAHDFSYPSIYIPTRISFPAESFTGLVHWPGWTAMDEWFTNPTANSLNALLTFGVNAWGRETDATSGRRVTYARGEHVIEENTNYDFSLYRALPGDFTGWDPEGITVSHRIVWNVGPPSPGETTTIVAEVFDPTNAGDVVVASASRVVTGATDAGYVDLVVPEAALTAAGFVPGDMVRLRIRSTAGGGFVSNTAHHRISRIRTAWVRSSGGGGGGSSTWLGLTDTPGSYAGQAGLVPQVNVGETALQFVALPAANPLPCSDRTIAADLTVPADKTCYAHDILIAAGVTVTILNTGELLIL